MMENIRIHLWIHGKVQGVFFRDSTVTHAKRLGVTGFVRNVQYESMVEAVFEGPRDKVEKLVEWCSQGSPEARVDKVEKKEEQYTGEFEDFRIAF